MGQQERKSEKGREEEVVSSLVVVLGSFFIISTLATSSEEATGQKAALPQPGKPNITKHTTSAWNGERGKLSKLS